MPFVHAYFGIILWMLVKDHYAKFITSSNETQFWIGVNQSHSYQNRDTIRDKRQATFPFDSTSSHCRVGLNDKECLPPFKNIAQGINVKTNTNCGLTKPQRLCRPDGACQLCQSQKIQNRFSPDYLTDVHDPQNQTCWASGFVQAGGPEQAVNLTLSLGKRFEAYYISLQPCSIGSLPDSIAIYKSSDFGRTWRPWHFFSIDCYRAFGLPTTDEYNSHITSANLQEVLCVALQPHESYRSHQMRKRRSMGIHSLDRISRTSSTGEFGPYFVSPDWVIAFSTTLGRPAQRPWSPALIDWMTMTDIRISMMRFPSNIGIGNYRTNGRKIRMVNGNSAHASYLRRSSLTLRNSHTLNQMKQHTYRDLRFPSILKTQLYSVNGSKPNKSLHTSSSSPEQQTNDLFGNEPDVLTESEFYAFADLAIGGRCKCNGHAADCFLNSDGKLKCACEHNTEGDDCERCKPGYMDRPWERATAQKANTCTRCDCNLHSDECRFSNSLYLMSNRVSGGICENCRHNTAGRNCQHCAEGFYRDWTKPISHEHVCIPCRCHPIGSLVRHECDRRSGQCRCKQGVTGLTCNRCQDQYHQTRSPTNPCTKDIPPQAMALAHTPVDIRCTPCRANKERIRLKKFCRKDAVFQAIFKARELHGTMARFEMQVTQIWRLNKQKFASSQLVYWSNENSLYSKESGKLTAEGNVGNQERVIPVWVHLNELRCKCPEIKLGIIYLIVTDYESYSHKEKVELRFTPKTALLPWRSSWKRRLLRFQRKQNRGACDRYKDSGKLRTQTSRRDRATQKWYPTAIAPSPLHLRQHRPVKYPTMLTAHRPYNQRYRIWYYPRK